MKTKEEIEQLAEKEASFTTDVNFCFGYRDGYIKGYTKCQQDMADVIASLKEQLREFQSKEPKYAVEGDYCAVCGCTEFWNDGDEEE